MTKGEGEEDTKTCEESSSFFPVLCFHMSGFVALSRCPPFCYSLEGAYAVTRASLTSSRDFLAF